MRLTVNILTFNNINNLNLITIYTSQIRMVYTIMHTELTQHMPKVQSNSNFHIHNSYPYSWAPAGIFPGGGGKPLGGPKKICEGGPPIFFRQPLKYAYRGGGVVLMAAEFFSRGPQIY